MDFQLNDKRKNEVVVITGASAGVGRATACEFAKHGAHIALIARGREGLEGAKRDVESLGGRAVIIECDVADPQQVEAAAERAERELGPIDVWVNDAMVTVLGPFDKVDLNDFKRVIEVTFLGQVYGTKAALQRMTPRDHGSIVQVSSALGFRGIPLQSAYCAAKHAINGFTESVRCELMHNKSNVQITVVCLPGVNTPQFEWGKNLMSQKPKPVGQIFQPEVPAQAIYYAAHTKRKRVLVGYPTVQAVYGERVSGALLDEYLKDAAWNGSLRQEEDDPNRPNNLYEPVRGDFGAHGPFDKQSTYRSPQLWINEHRGLLGLIGGAVLLTGLAVGLTQARPSKPIKRTLRKASRKVSEYVGG